MKVNILAIVIFEMASTLMLLYVVLYSIIYFSLDQDLMTYKQIIIVKLK